MNQNHFLYRAIADISLDLSSMDSFMLMRSSEKRFSTLMTGKSSENMSMTTKVVATKLSTPLREMFTSKMYISRQESVFKSNKA